MLQSVQYLGDGGFRWRAEFFTHERFVGFSVAQRFGDFAALGQRRHQPECRPGAQRLERREPAPPPLRCFMVSLGGGARGQLLEHVVDCFRQPRPFPIRPILEFRRVTEKEAV